MTLVRLLPLFFVVFSCNSASEKIIEQVEPPWGYVFDDWQGSPIDVITYIPPNATKNTPLLIVVPATAFLITVSQNDKLDAERAGRRR